MLLGSRYFFLPGYIKAQEPDGAPKSEFETHAAVRRHLGLAAVGEA